MQNVGEGRYDIRIEVKFPDDLTKEEVNELDKDIKARLPFYIQKVAAFRASRLSRHRPSDAQTDDPQDVQDNRVPLPVSLLIGIGTLLSLSDCLIGL